MNQRPFWKLLPYNNNRTAWKPIKFPIILIIPFGADTTGQPTAQSAPLGISISILDTIRRNRISGPFTDGFFFPNRELFTVNLNSIEIAERLLDLNDFEINDDTITIINRLGLRGDVPYIPNALYYDLSDIAVEVDDLASGRYQLSYNATIYHRVYDSRDNLICIDEEERDSIIHYVDIVHPGEVIDEMRKTTPQVWFSNQPLAKEPLFNLYKPLSDSLQNVYDEQSLMARINFVNEIFPEAIPYLGRILGWEIPYFPRSLDPLRRSVLRTTTEFQKSRGTYKGIKELFELFGFDIIIRNLWFDLDNKTLLEPQYGGLNGIDLIDVIQFEVMEAELISPGFYNKKIPLLKRPGQASEFENFVRLGSNVTIDAYAVTIGSPAHTILKDYSNSLSNPLMIETSTGFINKDLVTTIAGQELYATQTLNFNSKGELESQLQTGSRKIINDQLVNINPTIPNIELTFDGSWVDPNIAIYLFVSYRTQQVSPKTDLVDRRSNYFDIRLATTLDANLSTNLILDYAIEFLYRIKAFHSLLRRIFLTTEASEVYLVNDYCYGPRLSRSSDADIGQQQVPPAIIPGATENRCTEQDARLIGYKETDIEYRDRITTGLIEEWTAYQQYDSRIYDPSIILNLFPQIPDTKRNNGFYSEYGQDAFVGEYFDTYEFQIETPSPLVNQNVQSLPVQYFNYDVSTWRIHNRCTSFRHNSKLHFFDRYIPAPNLQDSRPICFKGRVNDQLAINIHTANDEQFALGPCRIKMGIGALFITPRQSTIVRAGVINRCAGSRSLKPIISSWRKISGEVFDNNWVGTQSRIGSDPIRIIGNTESVLHFWDRNEPLDATWNSAANRVPNLGIQRTNMHFPGTRFISMGHYNGTFVSSQYKLRPWDQDQCNQTLNSYLETRTDGNQYLVYDDRQFSFVGNDIDSDIPLMGSPTVSDIAPNEVVHAIFSQFADDDGLCPWDTNVTANNGLIEVPDLGGTVDITIGDTLFRSANRCVSTLVDFADGYPCVTGILTDSPNISGPYFTPLDPAPTDYLFLLNSGIRDGSQGIRMDCDCLIAPCGSTNPEPECNIQETPDDLAIDTRLILSETSSTCEFLMDGTIPTMFELMGN